MIPVYRGVQHQYGYGLGSLFKAALRTVTPLVKTGLHALKKEGIKQGIGAAQDILLHGKKPKNVLLSRAKETARSVGETLFHKPTINKRKPRKRSQLQSTSQRRKIVSKKHRTHYQRPLDIFD
jgi:hypothetical protein